MTGFVTAAVQPENAGPGLLGFLAIFGVALVTVLLMRSMVGHLRKVRYGPGPDGDTPGSGDAGDQGTVPPTDGRPGQPGEPGEPGQPGRQGPAQER